MGGRVLIAFVGLVGGTMQLAGQTPAAVRNQATDLIRGGKPVEAIAILEDAVVKAPQMHATCWDCWGGGTKLIEQFGCLNRSAVCAAVKNI
jgi:hypothetical protein